MVFEILKSKTQPSYQHLGKITDGFWILDSEFLTTLQTVLVLWIWKLRQQSRQQSGLENQLVNKSFVLPEQKDVHREAHFVLWTSQKSIQDNRWSSTAIVTHWAIPGYCVKPRAETDRRIASEAFALQTKASQPFASFIIQRWRQTAAKRLFFSWTWSPNGRLLWRS